MNNTLLGFSTIAIAAIFAFLLYFGWNHHATLGTTQQHNIWVATLDHSVSPPTTANNSSFFLVSAKGKKELKMEFVKGNNFQSASINATGDEVEIVPNNNMGIKSIRIRQQSKEKS